MRKYGAMPPPDKKWQVGKTAAAIVTVNRYEEAIQLLRQRIDAIKNGDDNPTEVIHPDVFLELEMNLHG